MPEGELFMMKKIKINSNFLNKLTKPRYIVFLIETIEKEDFSSLDWVSDEVVLSSFFGWSRFYDYYLPCCSSCFMARATEDFELINFTCYSTRVSEEPCTKNKFTVQPNSTHTSTLFCWFKQPTNKLLFCWDYWRFCDQTMTFWMDFAVNRN